MTLRRFFVVLRALDFSLEYDSKAGGIRTVEFHKTVGDRKIDVQLWGNGNHRTSHFLGGRMSTHPTSFSTPWEMVLAIQQELTRTDHPPRRTK